MSTPQAQTPRQRPRFRDTVLASGLVDEPQLATIETAVAGVFDRAATLPADWDQAVADRLVADKLLTPFQARELLAGRRRFRLGQYTVLDEVARGGMGQVFRAEHAMMGREVAVKVLPRAKATPESEAAFRREMRMLGRLDHENLVRAYDAGYDAMVYYLVTELVPGLDLKRQVQKHGPLDEARAASVISQAARGLAYAHEQGLVHRDVKPGNIIVMPDGRVKVLDLGLAGSQIEEESSRLGRVVGTMDYIAPEQIRAPDDVGPSADIYALGCTLYYAVTGQVPFPGGTRREKMQRHLSAAPVGVRELDPHISVEFGRVVEAMMAKDPESRIPSAADVVERLRPWTPTGPVAMPGRDGKAGGHAVGSEPPPLPADQPRGLAWLTTWGRQDSSVPPTKRAEEDLGWLARGNAASSEPTEQALSGVAIRTSAEFRRRRGGFVLALGQAFVLAAVVGLLFGVGMGLVQRIDPARFNELLLGYRPAALGWAAFLLLLAIQAVQLVASLGSGQRRR
jgi:eukaryotic-like serine/threonine-protein kinase